MRTKWVFLILGESKMVNPANRKLIPNLLLGDESPIPHSQIFGGPMILIPIFDSILQSKLCQ